jgi:uncharacterized membrane protein
MDRMLVVVFDSEGKAYEGKKALLSLDSEGSIGVFAYAVVTKRSDGKLSVKTEDDPGPIGTLVGTTVGTLIGLLGGPAAGVVAGAAGASLGATFDVDSARIGSDFIYDVGDLLAPNKSAVLAEIDEDWTAPVDTRMEAIGGKVVRRALSDVNETVNREDVAAMKADLAQFKAELAQSRAERKAKLQSMIDDLDSRIQTRAQKVKERREAAEQQARAKAQVLKKRAAVAGRAVRDLGNTPV